MKAYSQDLCLHTLQAVDAGQTKATVAQPFAVSLATVTRYVARRAATGHVRPRTSPGRPPRIPRSAYTAVRAQVERRPDAANAEHAAAWEETHGVRVSPWGCPLGRGGLSAA